MQNFCQFEVDFHVINKAVHLNCGFQVRLFLLKLVTVYSVTLFIAIIACTVFR